MSNFLDLPVVLAFRIFLFYSFFTIEDRFVPDSSQISSRAFILENKFQSEERIVGSSKYS